MRCWRLVLLCALFFLVMVGRAGAAPARQDEFVPGQLIVGLRPGYAFQSLVLPSGARRVEGRAGLEKLNATIVTVPAGQEEAYRRALQAMSGVQYAEPNYLVRADFIPDDARWSEQYGPVRVQAPAAWDVTTGSASVILAIVDSGIDAAHPEFAGRLLPGYDFVEKDAQPQDECGHGTHVAGIAAATGNNGQGIAGIAWGVRILPIRVLNAWCSGTMADLAEGIVAAVERGARVINLSVGSRNNSTLLENATLYAYHHGAAIIAAAGNMDLYGNHALTYPARYDWVLAVGASDASDQRAAFSCYGPELDIMAPGENILSTMPLGGNAYGKAPGYDTLSGTSMAAPHVAGAAALLASLPQFASPDAIYAALTATALDLGDAGRDDATGYGLLQIYAALQYTPSVTPAPTPDPPGVAYDILDTLACSNLVSYRWRDARTYGAAVGLFRSMDAVTLSLPFPFIFGGREYTTVKVTPDGYLTFDGQGGIGANFFLPGLAQPNQLLAVYWDDLLVDPTAGWTVYQATFGAPPQREFVVEWNNVPPCVSCSGLTFEAVLSEGSNEILFQYRHIPPAALGGASATIGVEYADGRAASQWSYNQAGAIADGWALRFVPYAPGDERPSASCAALVRPVSGGDVYWQPPFCVILPQPLAREAVLRLATPLDSAPALPGRWIDLNHKADIRLLISPPPPIAPAPEAYVCYQYRPADVLRAGGHVENLFLAAYDAAARRWQELPTSVNYGNGTIFARAPHFSYYAVAALAPQSLPVTGRLEPPSGPGWGWAIPATGLVWLLLGGAFLWRVYRRHRSG